HPHRSVEAGAGDVPTVRAEGDALDRVRVPGQGEDLQARGDVPDPRGGVGAAADDARSVGAEGYAKDASRVPFQAEQLRAGVRVPDPHGVVPQGAVPTA